MITWVNIFWWVLGLAFFGMEAFRVYREARQDPNKNRRISLSDRLYVVVASDEVTFVSLGMESIQSIPLGLDKAREIFRMIKVCCDLRESREAEIGELSWKISGSAGLLGDDRIIVQFSGPQGSTYEVIDRAKAASAVGEFTALASL